MVSISGGIELHRKPQLLAMFNAPTTDTYYIGCLDENNAIALRSLPNMRLVNIEGSRREDGIGAISAMVEVR